MENTETTVLRVSRGAILANAVLSALKMAAGLLARSGAMVSDAVHSLSDVFSTFIVIIGVKAAGKASDREHPYGHERMECVAAIVLAVVLLITGLFIGYEGIGKLSAPAGDLPTPGLAALLMAAVSIAVKEIMYQITRRAARRVRSDALMADAWHHRTDALSSIGALVGIGGARLGIKVLDPVASLVICLFIVKAAYDIFRDAISKMVDHSCDPETESAIRAAALAQPGVAGVDRMLSRTFGNRVYVEMEISADGDLSLKEAHAIAEKTHAAIEEAFPQIKHIMIHVNPAGETADS